jgi:hypothetical protein
MLGVQADMRPDAGFIRSVVCGMPRTWAPLAFRHMRIEAAFREAYSAKHAALDPLGFAFALAWCAAAAYRLGCAMTATQQAALMLLAAGSAAAAALQQLVPSAYSRHRSVILCVLRLALAAAAAVAAQMTALSTPQCGGSVAAFVVLQGGQHLLLAFCAFAWRLRLQLHLPLQAACLAAVTAANWRLAAAITAEPGVAAAITAAAHALSPTLAAAVSPATAVAAVTAILQVFSPTGCLVWALPPGLG